MLHVKTVFKLLKNFTILLLGKEIHLKVVLAIQDLPMCNNRYCYDHVALALITSPAGYGIVITSFSLFIQSQVAI